MTMDKNKLKSILKTVGSVCSGIEAASVAWESLGLKFKWFSEIADFPSQVLGEKYPNIVNLGDMNDIPHQLMSESISSPDLICAGTPCQAFSYAGWKNGLEDDRGNLTLKFVEIVEANDVERQKKGLGSSIIFWENVEGVLSDKTNAFGYLVSSLAGLSEPIENRKWPSSGLIRGPKRNVAWRVLDAKFFGLPQQRKRLYLLAGGTDFYPENILFEKHMNNLPDYPKSKMKFEKDGHKFEVFREYTDCLYSAYGTKWNGNAAAYNGSLFVVQDDCIRRLSPLECERLMGFPDNYTDIEGAKRTSRYQAIGNSWAVPVVKWIGKRLVDYDGDRFNLDQLYLSLVTRINRIENEGFYLDLGKDIVFINEHLSINCTPIPENFSFTEMSDIVSSEAPKEIYISPVGCHGIIRRKEERNLRINQRLEKVLINISSLMTPEEIEKISRKQKRGRFSDNPNDDTNTELKGKDKSIDSLEDQVSIYQISLFNNAN